jgi:hypothetical protein
MVRFAVILALLAGPAAADCFGPGLPQTVRYSSGHSVAILSHDAADLTFRTTLPDGTASATTLRQGLFPIVSAQAGATYRYTWLDPLPTLRDLKPGDHGSARADMVVEQASTSHVTVNTRVLRADTVTLGDCAYPVLVVEKTDILNGQTLAQTRLWLSQTLRFPLKTEAGGRHVSYRVATLE